VESESYEYRTVRCRDAEPTCCSETYGYLLQQGKSGAVPKINEGAREQLCNVHVGEKSQEANGSSRHQRKPESGRSDTSMMGQSICIISDVKAAQGKEGSSIH
jgi:hypothetical protein